MDTGSFRTRRILFVDADPAYLKHLRGQLRYFRRDWEMDFVTSSSTALEFLESGQYDIVVTDVALPDTDGLELLSLVKLHHPDMIRFLLSSSTDKKTVMKATGVAHQFLAKPVTTETLREAVLRATMLRERLTNESLLRVVARIDTLPSMPNLYAEVVRELERADPSLLRVGDVIAQDPGMTAKVLQLVNSAFFGLRQSVTNPRQAVSLLGIDTVVALVLGVHIFNRLDGAAAVIDLTSLWNRSMITANAAKAIAQAERLSKESVDEVYLAGLLHDCGLLLLAANYPAAFADMQAQSGSSPHGMLQAERIVFGATHQEVGAYLLALWGLPDTIIEAVAFHHDPGRAPARSFGPLTAVHVASIVAGLGRDEDPVDFDVDHIQAAGCFDRLDDWIDICREEQMSGRIPA